MQDSVYTLHSFLRMLHTAYCTSYIWHGRFGIIGMRPRNRAWKAFRVHGLSTRGTSSSSHVRWIICCKIRAGINWLCSYCARTPNCNHAILHPAKKGAWKASMTTVWAQMERFLTAVPDEGYVVRYILVLIDYARTWQKYESAKALLCIANS